MAYAKVSTIGMTILAASDRIYGHVTTFRTVNLLIGRYAIDACNSS
jgi:hypothetical protein